MTTEDLCQGYAVTADGQVLFFCKTEEEMEMKLKEIKKKWKL